MRACFRYLLPIAVATLLVAPLLLAWVPTSSDSSGSSPPLDWSKFVASLAVSAAAGLVALIIGSVLSLLFTLTDLRGSRYWLTCCLIPFLAPATVWALGYVYCFGSGGLLEKWLGDGHRPAWDTIDRGSYVSTAIMLALTYAPLSMFLLSRAAARLHWAGLASALLALDRPRLLRWLLLALRRDLAGAFLLTFALSLGNFATPHVFQCRLLAIDIYMRAANYLDPQGALLASLPLLLTALAAAWLFAWCEPIVGEALPQTQRGATIRLGRWKPLVIAGLTVWVLLTIVLPISATVAACGSPGQFLAVVSDAIPETESTLLIGLGTAVVACVAGAVISVGLTRRASRFWETLAIMPLGIPALLVALAYARFYNRTWPLDLTFMGNTSLLVVLGLAFRAWPFATRIIRGKWLAMADPCREASRLASVSRWRQIGRMELPQLADSLAAAAMLAFVIAVGEVEISQMLCAPGYGTLALRLFTYLHFGPTHIAASLALLQLTLAIIPVILFLLVFDRRPAIL